MDPYTAPAVQDDADPGFDERGLPCPCCGAAMEPGFAASDEMRFLSRARMRAWFPFLGELLSRQTSLKRFLRIGSHYFCSHLCRACGCYIVDTTRELSQREASGLAVRGDQPLFVAAANEQARSNRHDMHYGKIIVNGL